MVNAVPVHSSQLLEQSRDQFRSFTRRESPRDLLQGHSPGNLSGGQNFEATVLLAVADSPERGFAAIDAGRS